MRESGGAEEYVRLVQDMYQSSMTVLRWTLGVTDSFKVEVGMHQGSALSPYLLAMVKDRLTDEVRHDSPWMIMFADDTGIYIEAREQAEENLERWKSVLNRRGRKVSDKTEYMCVNRVSTTVRLQGVEMEKAHEFKYLGSSVESNRECGVEMKQ